MTQHLPAVASAALPSVVINPSALRLAASTLDGLSTRAATSIADRELRPLLHQRTFPDSDLQFIAAGVDSAGDRVEKLLDRHLQRLAEFCRRTEQAASQLDASQSAVFEGPK
jgi:hypothetical protein